MAVGLGGFAIGYWALQATQQPDWDYPSLSGRFDGSAWRFDNNQLIINYLLHPLAGGEMYALARANHHDPFTSAGYSTLSSFLWEFVFEYREFVSVNDLLATSFPGVAVGEFLHKLALHLEDSKAPAVVRWTLGPGHELDRWLDGADADVGAGAASPSNQGPLWHDFRAELSGGVIRNDSGAGAPLLATRFAGRLVSLPGYDRPGETFLPFHRADFASLGVEAFGSPRGAGLRLTAETLILGAHLQWLDAGRDLVRKRRNHGVMLTAGVPIAYTYLESHAAGFPELLGAFHMPGVRLEGNVRSSVADAALGLRASPDFVGVGAYGYDDWERRHPEPQDYGKHILRNQGYHYAFGGSVLLEGGARLGPLTLHAGLLHGRWRSQEGLNRWQERITIDVPAGTNLLDYRLGARLSPPASPVSVGATVQLRRWSTFIGEVERHAESLTRSLDLALSF